MPEDESKIVLETLSEISEIAANAKDLPSLWQPLFEVVLKTLNVDAGTLMTLESDVLVRRVAVGMGKDIMKEAPIPEEKGGISWGVVHEKKAKVIEDISKENIASKALMASMHSLVTVPMMSRGTVIGVMSIFTKAERNFTQKDVDLFQTIANQAAVAVISLRMTEILEENHKRLNELAALNEISKSIATLFNFEETLYSIVGLITRMLNADKGLLVLFNHREKLLQAVKPAFNLSDAQIRDFRTRTDEGITGQSFCKGVPVVMEKLDKSTRDVLSRAKISGINSALAAPLKVKSQTLGVIHILSNNENNFSQNDVQLFSLLSAQAAVVVSSAYTYREIEEERKKDAALLGSIGEGVLAVDLEQKIIMLNEAGEQITGFLAEELIDRNVDDVLGIKGLPLRQVFADSKPINIEQIQINRHDGTTFPAFISCAPIHDADEKVIGAIVAFRDISKELEVDQMKKELVSIATHELRTPITGLKGYLEMIIEGDTGGVNEETKEIITEMASINQRLADLVDDLLNVGRIEDGRIEVKPVQMDLCALIEQVVHELDIQAKKKGLSLNSEFIIHNSKIMVKADPERVRQVLINLIGNAIKYTETGSVTVIARSGSDAAISPNGSPRPNGTRDDMVIISVKDTGLGMSIEGQKKLFEKFYRVKTDKTRAITGTGLGLWITKKLVEMMNGKISVASEEGKGSTFSFSLPRA